MKIFIISRSNMRDLLSFNKEVFDPDNFNIISIVDPEDNFLFEEPLKENIIQLKFSDIEGDEPEGCDGQEDWILFNEEHGKKIIKFIDNLDTKKNLIIHCFAGISRSGAVGDFARIKFGIPFDGEFQRTNHLIQPNPHMAKVLRELYFNTANFGDEL